MDGTRRPSEAPPAAPRPLPPGIDLLWGRRARGGRGPRPGLSVDAIVTAAIELADAEGLEAVSMARVAKALGFTTMSLYRYVASKDELLTLMWNASAVGVESLTLDGATWREKLRAWALVQRDMIDRHAWITQMPMAAPPLAPNSMTFVELGLASLDDTGLPGAEKLRMIGLLSSYTLSEARMANDAARAAAAAMAAAAETGETPAASPGWTFETLLRELVDERTYPRLHAIAWSGEIGDDPSGFDERAEFLLGVDTILDGVAALIDRYRGASDDGQETASAR
ncbi:TetR/AcrR family transcriptional regulator [Candidatus Frankia nodulisporulans]|uniref:TetR/AcrR family transcriptional regulator n=1 Tax=Candidatus Frankia nodulisporulans TaxID=2060052 RepID=UPI0013D06A7C|nr:TetR/AcrR family transcriptional regulator [Candidatus Frankia nodulisporulans]